VSGCLFRRFKWARLSAAATPGFTANLRTLLASLVGLDEIEEARRVAERMLELEPGFTLESYERTRQPFRDAAIKTRLLAHLRTAGLPP
jgi:adenylate cyclase